MLTKQLSIFLENKQGRLTEVTEVLGKAGVNLVAISIADNTDFGILRCIVSDPERAYEELKKERFTVKIHNVVKFVCPDTCGSLAKILRQLSDQGIFIEYMYSFSFAGSNEAHIVIRPTDIERCEAIIETLSV
ncbi:MAG: amino acid-binding protein [Prevotella sp.]|nr:amino acid-binding protein [Prevotella sp.]